MLRANLPLLPLVHVVLGAAHLGVQVLSGGHLAGVVRQADAPAQVCTGAGGGGGDRRAIKLVC